MDDFAKNKGPSATGVPPGEPSDASETDSNNGEAFTIDSAGTARPSADVIPVSTNSFGAIALRRGWITDEQLKNAIELQKQNKKKLGAILVEQEILTPQQVAEILAEQLHIEFMDVRNYVYDGAVADLIPRRMIERYNVLPLKKQNNKLYIVTADPLDFQAIENIRLATGLSVVPYLGLEEEIRKVIFQYFGAQAAAQEAIEVLSGAESESVEVEDEDLSMTYNDAPIVSLVNTILESAIRENASDIHMEPTPINMRVRQRIDGMLRQTMMIPKRVQPLVTSRIKIMGKLDIAEKRRPQDGKIRVFVDRREVDIRLSTVPTIYGEKLVMRLLDKSRGIVPLPKLGLSEVESAQVRKMISTPNGIILLCGPTGSGKTTTLYSILNELNNPDINITTIEDPVEYQLEGINQVNVNVKAGLTFANALRSFLRQDPDIIMVGEIRDRETAEIAVQAALTGHLVLSSIHTNDAPSTVSRMRHTGIEPFLISASLTGVIAQRLVRRVCRNCAREVEYDEEKLASIRPYLPPDTELHFKEGEGCSLCHHTGLRGRTAIYEIMLLTPTLREMIVRGKDTEELREIAKQEGMVPLIESGMLKAAQGITTVEEVLRAARTDEEAVPPREPRAIPAHTVTHLKAKPTSATQPAEPEKSESPPATESPAETPVRESPVSVETDAASVPEAPATAEPDVPAASQPPPESAQVGAVETQVPQEDESDIGISLEIPLTSEPDISIPLEPAPVSQPQADPAPMTPAAIDEEAVAPAIHQAPPSTAGVPPARPVSKPLSIDVRGGRSPESEERLPAQAEPAIHAEEKPSTQPDSAKITEPSIPRPAPPESPLIREPDFSNIRLPHKADTQEEAPQEHPSAAAEQYIRTTPAVSPEEEGNTYTPTEQHQESPESSGEESERPIITRDQGYG